MEASQPTQPTQATQQATQPYADPRRKPRTLSELSERDVADIICILHANSPTAAMAVRATMLHAPEHILQNEDLEGVTAQDLGDRPELESRTREIALRMSSTVTFPREGFRFGRNPAVCDILLTDNPRHKLVSNVHFKIYVNDQGSLMVEDCSTNGTIVDDEHLRSKQRDGKPFAKPSKRVLRNGSIITILANAAREELKLIVRIPNRADYEDLYDQKLRDYLTARGILPKFASVRESSFGNFWSGGAIYNFTGNIGKGAFASVYRVQTKSEGTVYAAKEIDKRRFMKNGILDVKFDNELQIMQKLKHPNIVEYVDCQTVDHWIYIIMEFVPCGELTKELARRGHLPEHEVQQITKQTLRALDYLHRQGITHRDIKPDNILISSRRPLVVKLSDFGLSKAVVDQDTFLKTFCGTLLYCAPEVYPEYGTYAQPTAKRRRHSGATSKTAPYDSSADIWSFGAVVFHLLAGKAPIIGRGENGGAQMLENIMTKPVDFQPLRELGVSEDGINFVSLLLNKNPAFRPTEQQCFAHPWLRDIPDLLDYSGVSNVDVRLRGQLEDVQEGDEDPDADIVADLAQLAQQRADTPHAGSLASTPVSPERPPKKPKMTRADSTIPEEILYPLLPSNPNQIPSPPSHTKTPKLFGEITPSVLKSSGLFGGVAGPAPPHLMPPSDVPHIRDRLEQVSMNDWASYVRGQEGLAQSEALLPRPWPHEKSFAGPSGVAGSAASLMGAEAQMGQMNMGSPASRSRHVEKIAEAENPDGPRGRSGSGSAHHSGSSRGSSGGDQSRLIDVNLLTDEAAFAEEQRLRQSAREENARLKVQTFHVSAGPMAATLAAPVTKTFSGPAAVSAIQRSDELNGDSDGSADTEVLRQVNMNTLTAPLDVFGRLTPVEGSFNSTPIQLRSRSTLWGRAVQCNCQYADLQDVRVPKFGLKIVFYAPGIEQVESNGGEWTKVPRIRTIIATSATRGIKVNGVRLLQESEDGKAALFGKIYTGDVVTILDSEAPGAYLKYRVEIFFGMSAQQRPETEKPFVVEKEYHHHARMKEQGPPDSGRGQGQNMHATPNEIEVA